MSHSVIAPSDIPRASVTACAGRVGWRQRIRASLRFVSAALLIVGMLGGATYVGYMLNWRVPKFSELWGSAAAEKPRWCEEHGVPEADCLECNPDRFPPDKDHGWCPVHGVAQCPFEHPEVAETKEPTYLTDGDRARASRALALMPRGENNSRCKLYLRRIQFADHEAAERAGVDVAIVDREPVVEAITANGEVMYDETRLARLASRVAGTVHKVFRQVGDPVRAGDLLALVDSADVGRAKAEMLQAISHRRLTSGNLARLKPLGESGAIPVRQLREAEAADSEAQIRLMAARQALVNLGFDLPEDHFGDLSMEVISDRLRRLGLSQDLSSVSELGTATSNLFPLRSPLGGVVVERTVVAGEVVDTARSLFTVGDVSRMWLVLQVRQDDVRLIKPGASVRFGVADRTGDTMISGQVSWMSTAADERTRTVKVRVDLPNEEGILRANTFGTGKIILREGRDSIVVPAEAVHWDGCCHVVFVRDRRYFDQGAPKFYHVRQVRIGVKENGKAEILAGLVPGEVIAAEGSTVLASQLLRSNLGAGCDCANGH